MNGEPRASCLRVEGASTLSACYPNWPGTHGHERAPPCPDQRLSQYLTSTVGCPDVEQTVENGLSEQGGDLASD